MTAAARPRRRNAIQDHEASVWFITGCSTGFGRELARLLLERGRRVVVTARDPDQVADLARAHADRALALRLDVTSPDQVAAALQAAQARFGRIDVLVNNAGIGYFGAVEESDEAEVRRMFEINFWGLSAMTRAVLPGMRERRSGRSANETPDPIPDYDESSGARARMIRASSGNQAGDPVRAAAAIIAAVEAKDPPLRLLLGRMALEHDHFDHALLD